MKRRESLQEAMERFAAPMALSVPDSQGGPPGKGKVRCVACGHRCLIPEGRAGVCKVRFNRGGVLYGPRGYVAGIQDDPIEKKPFNHALPGTRALSFGMLGCDFHCGYCQNWVTSQALRDEAAGVALQPVEPADLLALARRVGASTLTSTYNEPLITSEWAVEVFREAKAQGFYTCYVSNGNTTAEVIRYIRPWLDFYKIDLKGFDDARYRKLGGTLQSVLEGIERVHRSGLWLEVLTLIVPGFNDSEQELRGIAGFLRDLSPDIPWHVTAFHPDYKFADRGFTPAATLLKACAIGRQAGLRYVYAGNLPGQVQSWEDTHCPECKTLLVQRRGFAVRQYALEGSQCPRCHATIPGVWHTPQTWAAAQLGAPARVTPLRA